MERAAAAIHADAGCMKRSLTNITGMAQDEASRTVDAALQGDTAAQAKMAQALQGADAHGMGFSGFEKNAEALGRLQLVASGDLDGLQSAKMQQMRKQQGGMRYGRRNCGPHWGSKGSCGKAGYGKGSKGYYSQGGHNGNSTRPE